MAARRTLSAWRHTTKRLCRDLAQKPVWITCGEAPLSYTFMRVCAGLRVASTSRSPQEKTNQRRFICLGERAIQLHFSRFPFRPPLALGGAKCPKFGVITRNRGASTLHFTINQHRAAEAAFNEI